MNDNTIVISHLVDSYTGSPNVLNQAILAISNKNLKVQLNIGDKSKKGILAEGRPDIKYYFFKQGSNKIVMLAYFLISQAHLFFRLFFKYRKSKNVIFYVNSIYPFGAALAGKLLNKPVYYHIHEFDLDSKSFGKVLKFLAMYLSDKLIFVSDSLKQSYNIHSSKTITIPNSISQKVWDKAKFHYPLYPIKDSKFNILMLASFKKYKGVKEFFKLAEKIEKQSSHISFTLVLSCEVREWEVNKHNYEVPINTTVHTKQSNTIPFYKSTHLVLNLSLPDQWVETFGLTIIEGMAFGIPVIAPNCGGPTEIIGNGIDGFLVDPYNTQSIVNLVHKLTNDSDLWNKMSSAAKKKSLNYSPDIFGEKIINALNLPSS